MTGSHKNENRIRELRKEKGWTGKELAAKIGRSSGFIYNLENGNKRLNKDMLYDLAHVFNVSSDYILKMSDKKDDSYTVDINKMQSKLINLPIVEEIGEGGKRIYGEDTFPIDISKLDDELEEYFFLRITEDTMSPIIKIGDVALIRRQKVIEDGRIGLIICNNKSATLAKINVLDNKIILSFDNDKYETKITSEKECRIMGQIIGHYRQD